MGNYALCFRVVFFGLTRLYLRPQIKEDKEKCIAGEVGFTA